MGTVFDAGLMGSAGFSIRCVPGGESGLLFFPRFVVVVAAEAWHTFCRTDMRRPQDEAARQVGPLSVRNFGWGEVGRNAVVRFRGAVR